VDASRTAALGASFGGYMVNWIAGHADRFRCLVSHAGLYDLAAFHGTTDCGPEWELEFGGVPWEHPELYETWSPHRHAGAFRTPTLVVHGELDYRVPLGEGLQMFQALQKRRVPSKLLYFPDENHWILKPANMLLWNEAVLSWLAEWLGPTPKPAPATS
jgi:dipeptidyl aminopeptidase/acylaminoacyl peptidase